MKRQWPDKQTEAGWTKDLAMADLFDTPNGHDWDARWKEIIGNAKPVKVTYRMRKEIVLA